MRRLVRLGGARLAPSLPLHGGNNRSDLFRREMPRRAFTDAARAAASRHRLLPPTGVGRGGRCCRLRRCLIDDTALSSRLPSPEELPAGKRRRIIPASQSSIVIVSPPSGRQSGALCANSSRRTPPPAYLLPPRPPASSRQLS